MATNPNADYSNILDSTKKTFPAIYDSSLAAIARTFHLSEELQQKLAEKRAFGLQKYGDRAFQSSIENAAASPAAAHLGDEIVDAYNYTLHGYYISNLEMNEERRRAYERVFSALSEVSYALELLAKALPDGEEKDSLKWASASNGAED
jgi:hypothetical protein